MPHKRGEKAATVTLFKHSGRAHATLTRVRSVCTGGPTQQSPAHCDAKPKHSKNKRARARQAHEPSLLDPASNQAGDTADGPDQRKHDGYDAIHDAEPRFHSPIVRQIQVAIRAGLVRPLAQSG